MSNPAFTVRRYRDKNIYLYALCHRGRTIGQLMPRKDKKIAIFPFDDLIVIKPNFGEIKQSKEGNDEE